MEQIQDLLNDTKNIGDLGICFNVYFQDMVKQPEVLI